MERHIDINQFDYDLPDERIAKFPLAERSASKLLVYRNGAISESRFDRLGEELPEGAMLVFNNTKVIRARIIMHKPSGARIEVFCLEPHAPADYERAFAVKGKCAWSCIVGNLKKWKEGALVIDFTLDGTPQQLRAYRTGTGGREQIVRFEWEADLTFGELLELLGRIPIPPYLNRDSQQIDYTRYQTVYSKFEGSVAAPTAGLHFTPELIASLGAAGVTDAGLLVLGLMHGGLKLPAQFSEGQTPDETLPLSGVLREPALIAPGPVMSTNLAFGGSNTALIFEPNS